MFKISKEVYLDTFTKCYKNIIILSKIPENDNEIKKHIRTIPRNKLSPFKTFDCCNEKSHCVHAFIRSNSREFISIENIEDVIGILSTLGYMIDYDLTKIMLKNQNNKEIKIFDTSRPKKNEE